MMAGFQAQLIERQLYRIVDINGNHAYLALGSKEALLVDTCAGFGDLSEFVRSLTNLPVRVALTHYHYDHSSGAYFFPQVYLNPSDSGQWSRVEDQALRVHAQMVDEGLLDSQSPLGPRDGRRPQELPVWDGDRFYLGGRIVRAVSLPGHSMGSMGYLVEDCAVLLSGDAVTPIMCLCFEDSLPISGWQATLAKMQELPFEHFYTGHHDYAFPKASLASFDKAASFVADDRGMYWTHARIGELRGILHICPSSTINTESPDFRAVIEPWHDLPPRRQTKRRSSAASKDPSSV